MTSSLPRVAAFLGGYFLILFAAAVPKGMAPRHLADLVWGSLSSVGVFALTRLLLSREQRPTADVGLQPDARTAGRLVGGFAIGIAVYVATVLTTSITLGRVRLSAPVHQGVTTWLLVIASFLALSCMEELGFRAYALRTLIPAMGAWQAQFAIAVVFGFSHLASGWPWQTVALGVIPSALLYGAAAVRSGGLALPIGIHAAANVAYWAVGAKETPGVWTLSVEPAHIARVNAIAPYLGMTVTLLAAVLIGRWSWPPRARPAASAGPR